MKKKVIDVSAYQGAIDWEKAKDVIDGAVLKVIRKDLNPDKRFEENWEGCKSVGVPIVGVYNYSYATTVEKAKEDARKVLKILNGRRVKIWLDVEDACQKGLGKNLINIINAYADVIQSAGYKFGVYTGLAFYTSYIRPWAGYLKCGFWIARYPSTRKMAISQDPQDSKQPLVYHTLEGWQYTSAGIVAGVQGNVDISIWYGDIPEEKPAGNPYPVPERILSLKWPHMKGDDVGWTQYHLIRLGFLKETDEDGKNNLDRDFGKKTNAAVIAAKKHYGLPDATGKVDAETIRILRWN